MGSSTFYNDNDRKVCAWLRQLANDGHISPGTVNETSIAQLSPDDVRGYRRVHFFAGIGGWDYALKLAGWPEDREVWTGSCPCQPFSVAGKGKGVSDERHLWPEKRRLIADRLPATVFGEQVASKAGREWFAGVRDDLEKLGYAVGCADLCAASKGAPHIRQRLFWCASRISDTRRIPTIVHAKGCIGPSDCQPSKRFAKEDIYHPRLCATGGLLDASGTRRGELRGSVAVEAEQSSVERAGAWDRFILVPCGDGKTRRIEPGLAPLVDGVPARVVRIRGYGNAIVPQVAAEFVMAFMEAEREA